MPINVIVDLSHNNDSVDFATAAAAGIVGVIHKATEGIGWVDPCYADRQLLARDAGMLWGAYHFGTGRHAGSEQADFFLATVGRSTELLCVLDFEENPSGPSLSLAQARDFVRRIYEQTGRWPGLYAGNYLREALGDATETELTNCWLWHAEYATRPARLPPQWTTWTMWQYTDGESGQTPRTVPGIGPCDRDQFNGDLPALRQLWIAAASAVA
jgi:lysozyme